MVDLHIKQGSTFSHGWLVTYNGAALDATWTARSQIRAKAESAVILHEFEVAVNPDGSVVLGVDAETSSTWAWRSAFYDLEVVNADASVTQRIAEGRVTVSPEVTR